MIESLPSTPKLNEALIAAQAEMPVVPFDSTNPFLKNRYASLGSVISVSKPVLTKHGLAIEQQPISINGQIGVRTILRHISGESSCGDFTIPVEAEKGKSAAQVAGSIITYLRRYAWSSVCGLYADEDNDGHDPEPRSHSPTLKAAPQPQTCSTPQNAPTAKPAPAKATPASTAKPSYTPDDWKKAFIKAITGDDSARFAYVVFANEGWLIPGVDRIDEVDPAKFPQTRPAWNEVMNKVKAVKERAMNEGGMPQEQVEAYEMAYGPDGAPEPKEPATRSKPAPKPAPPQGDEAWRIFPMPWGKNAGKPLAQLEKNYLFGLWANYTVETEYQGKPKRPESIAKDRTFRLMLDQAGEHYEFSTEKKGGENPSDPGHGDDEDDVPYDD